MMKTLEEMTPFDQLDKEWLAWRQVCLHLEKLGIDIDKQDPLTCAIRLWGEELIELYRADPEGKKYHEMRLLDCRQKYKDHAIYKK